jgi:hypothetical protein
LFQQVPGPSLQITGSLRFTSADNIHIGCFPGFENILSAAKKYQEIAAEGT